MKKSKEHIEKLIKAFAAKSRRTSPMYFRFQLAAKIKELDNKNFKSITIKNKKQ